MRVIAIDPEGCGCTECLIGEYVPLDRLCRRTALAYIWGSVANNTGLSDDELDRRCHQVILDTRPRRV